MIVTIFRSRLKPAALTEYAPMAERMVELARSMPGFISVKTFSAQDGERVTIVEFQSEETHDAWRNHAEHRVAQRLGREKFYSEFRLQVCEPIRDYGFKESTA